MPVAGTNSIIDISHYQTIASFAAIKQSGITGIVHKATEGTFLQDPDYLTRKPAALAQGFLWGCYHYSSGEDPVAQANYFLDFAKPGASELVALDCEPSSRKKGSPQPPNMTYVQLVSFVRQIQTRLGRLPVIYGGGTLLTELMKGNAGSLVNACPLWFAEWPGATATAPPDPLPEGWTTWTLWQYTADGVGPSPTSVAGITNAHCDRDTYNGSPADLAAKWPFTNAAGAAPQITEVP